MLMASRGDIDCAIPTMWKARTHQLKNNHVTGSVSSSTSQIRKWANLLITFPSEQKQLFSKARQRKGKKCLEIFFCLVIAKGERKEKTWPL